MAAASLPGKTLLGKTLSYAPAVVVPAALQFLTVAVFTHLMGAEAFGRYALVMVSVQIIDIVAFAWLRSGEMRFHQARVIAGSAERLFADTQILLLGLALAILGGGIPAVLGLIPDRALALAMVSGLVFLVLRAALLQALNRHRLAGAAMRYGLIEIGRAVLSFAVAVVLATVLGLEEQALLVGGVVVLAVLLIADLSSVAVRLTGLSVDPATARTLFAFGLPATLAILLADLITLADRYIIGFFWGNEAVGVYAVAGSLARQSVALLFSVTLVAAYPLLMQVFESEGTRPAQRRLRENFAVVLSLALPATVGLALTAGHVAAVCLGGEYRQAGAQIPWIALTAFLGGMKIHVYDHVFHLQKRTGLLLLLSIPVAVLNIGLNVALVPGWGVDGAIAAGLASCAGGLLLTVWAATRLMPVPVPLDTVWRSLLAAGAMAAVLILPDYPKTPAGLGVMVAAGALAYAAVGWMLDLLGCRTVTLAAVQRRL